MTRKEAISPIRLSNEESLPRGCGAGNGDKELDDRESGGRTDRTR